MPIFVVDAFTSEPFRGNPGRGGAGNTAPTTGCRQVAAEMQHSETAFVAARDDGAFDLRWFSPEVEVDLCGHATLASAHVLYETGRVAPGTPIVFHTRSGELRAEHAGDGAGSRSTSPSRRPVPAPPIPELFDALGPTRRRDRCATDGQFFMVVVDDAATVRELAPDFTQAARPRPTCAAST